MPKPNSVLYHNPEYRTVDDGENSYTKVMDAPSYLCTNLMAYCVTQGAVISFDGGKTDHIVVPATKVIVLQNLLISPLAVIMAKNFTADSNYTLLSVSLW